MGELNSKAKQSVIKSALIRMSIALVFLIIGMSLFIALAFHYRDVYAGIYSEAVILLDEGKTEEALNKFCEIPNYLEFRDVRSLLSEYYELCPHCGYIIEEDNKE